MSECCSSSLSCVSYLFMPEPQGFSYITVCSIICKHFTLLLAPLSHGGGGISPSEGPISISLRLCPPAALTLHAELLYWHLYLFCFSSRLPPGNIQTRAFIEEEVLIDIRTTPCCRSSVMSSLTHCQPHFQHQPVWLSCESQREKEWEGKLKVVLGTPNCGTDSSEDWREAFI